MRKSKNDKPRLSKAGAKLRPQKKGGNHVLDGTRAGERKTRPDEAIRGLNEMLTDADNAKLIAAKHCLFHYPTLYAAGIPRAPSIQGTDLWTVPIIATHPEKGMLAEVGELTVDVRRRKVVAGTPRAQVVAKGAHFYKVKRDAPKAAHSVQAGEKG